MKLSRQIARIRWLLQDALAKNDQHLVAQYTWGLFIAQADMIKELEKERAKLELEKRYRKAV